MSTNNLKAESKFRLWLLPVSVIVTLSAGRYALSAAYSSTQAHRDFKILDDK